MNTVSEIHSLQLRGTKDGEYSIVAMGEIFGVTLCHPKTLAEAEVVMDAIYAAMPDTSITQTS